MTFGHLDHTDLLGDLNMPAPSRRTGYPAWFRQSLAYDLAILGPRPPSPPAASPPASMARMRCSRCQQVRYWTPRCLLRLMAEIGLAVLSTRNMARNQCRNGRCEPSRAVPTVTVNCLLHALQR